MGDTAQIEDLVAPFANEQGGLLPALHAVQKKFGYIDKQWVPTLAHIFNQTRADIYGVLSFYHDFREEKPEATIVKICQAEACQAQGLDSLTRHIAKNKPIGVTIEKVYCLGNCACGPAVMINDKIYGRVDAAKLDALIVQHKGANK